MSHNDKQFCPLEQVTRPTVTTEEAAHYLNRSPQTLRCWASTEPAGMPRPVRINGRLAWPVSEIRVLQRRGAR
jgi:predicted DNA-binding transcriptional regulator AlpA